MAGRRLREAIKETLISNRSVEFDDQTHIVIAGLTYTYSQYVSTFEEYKQQRYETNWPTIGSEATLIAVQNAHHTAIWNLICETEFQKLQSELHLEQQRYEAPDSGEEDSCCWWPNFCTFWRAFSHTCRVSLCNEEDSQLKEANGQSDLKEQKHCYIKKMATSG